MSKEQYELLKDSMAEIVTVAEKYEKHLQPTVADCLSAALIADSSGISSEQRHGLHAKEATNGEIVKQSTDRAEWDFRSQLLKMMESYDLSRIEFKDPEFTALLAFVFRRHAPNERKNEPITVDHLEDACRTIDRNIPSQPASTLSTAKADGLLDKVKGQAGYTLTPKGENRVNEILAAQDKS